MPTTAGSFTLGRRNNDGELTRFFVEYSEDPDSVEINVTENGIFAQRKIKIPWASVWDFVQGMGTVVNRGIDEWAKQYDDDTTFPTFPAQQDGFTEKRLALAPITGGTNAQKILPKPYEYFGCSLKLTNIRVVPSWDGRQKEINTENVSSTTPSRYSGIAKTQGMISYQYADVVLEYEQRNPTKQMNKFESGISFTSEKEDRKFNDGSQVVTPVPRVEDSNEVVSFYRSQDFENLISVDTLNNATGSINDDNITLFFGRDHKTFLPYTLLFTGFEMRNNYFLGQFGFDCFLRFSVAPDFSGWNAIYDTTTKTYKVLDDDDKIYSERDFTDIFPPQWDVSMFRT